jgi:hypothetical protein
MKMGRERNVLRWDIHASLLRERLERVERALGAAPAPAGDRAAQLAREAAALQRQLQQLGPSPRAKMG